MTVHCIFVSLFLPSFSLFFPQTSMEAEIHQAVEIALSGTADANLKSQAIDFINRIKSTPEGFRSSVDILVGGGALSDELKFFVYQVIEENIERLLNEQLYTLNKQLMGVLGGYVSQTSEDTAYLKNKFALLMARMFTAVYLEINPQFLSELAAQTFGNKSRVATDYYTRIIVAIHYEIADKLLARTSAAVDRNTLLKDAIRARDMASLTQSWYAILQSPTEQSDEILNNTLTIIGQYIQWMEISLFIAPERTAAVKQYLETPAQRNEACATLVEMILKKMKPANKLELLELLDLTLTIAATVGAGDTGDVEYMENVARLLNQVGTEVMIVVETGESLHVERAQGHLYKLWPLVLEVLAHEYDDVLQQVFPFVQQYLLVCKRVAAVCEPEVLSQLLNKVIVKMKYDDDDDGDNDEEDEQFREVRARLKVFQNNIAVLRPDLYLEAIPLVVSESVFAEGADWRQVELGLYELGNFAESLRNNLVHLPKGAVAGSKPHAVFLEFLVKLIHLRVIVDAPHPKVQTAFFELVVRQYSFLGTSSGTGPSLALVHRIMEIFTSPYGLFHEEERVRLRVWYLFLRFVKLARPQQADAQFVQGVVAKLAPLLVIKAELPTQDEDNETVEHGCFNNQLHLYEAVGLLVALTDADSAAALAQAVFQPLFADLERCVGALDHAKENEPLVALQAHHALMAMGTFVRGYDADATAKPSEAMRGAFNNAAQVVLITLENFPKHEVVRELARAAFARLIPILKADVSVHLSKLVTLVLGASNLRVLELSDFLSFLGQIVHNFQNDANVYLLLNDLLTPTVKKVFAMLEDKADGVVIPDLVRDQNQLKKAMMNLLNQMVLNHVASLLVTATNRPVFPDILNRLFAYAYDLSDTSVLKLAITQLVNIVLVFGATDGKIHDADDKYSDALGPLEGIDGFLMDKVTQVSFELPFKNREFDLKDAQYRLIAQEISLLLSTYQKTRGADYLAYLVRYLGDMGLSDDLVVEFGRSLEGMDAKGFRRFFVEFVGRLK